MKAIQLLFIFPLAVGGLLLIPAITAAIRGELLPMLLFPVSLPRWLQFALTFVVLLAIPAFYFWSAYRAGRQDAFGYSRHFWIVLYSAAYLCGLGCGSMIVFN